MASRVTARVCRRAASRSVEMAEITRGERCSRVAMMAITTSSSTRVNPRRLPVTIGHSVESDSGAEGMDVEDITSRRGGVGRTGVGTQAPGGLGATPRSGKVGSRGMRRREMSRRPSALRPSGTPSTRTRADWG